MRKNLWLEKEGRDDGSSKALGSGLVRGQTLNVEW